MKRRRRILVLGLLALLALFCFIYIFAHPLLQGWLVSKARQAGLEKLQFSVDHVGFSRVDIAGISSAGNGLAISGLSIDYSLPQILKGRVRRLTVTGMKLTVARGQTGWGVQGLENLFNQPSSSPLVLPFGELIIRHSLLRVVRDNQSWDIPFDLWLRKTDQRDEYSLEVNGKLLGRTLHVSGALHPQGRGTLQVDIPELPLGELGERLGLLPGVTTSATVPLQAEIGLFSWGLERVKIQVGQVALQATGADVHLLGAGDFRAEFLPGMKLANLNLQATVSTLQYGQLALQSPVTIRILGKQLEALNFEVAGLKPKGQPVEIEMIRGTLVGLPDRLEIRGSYQGRLLPAFLTKGAGNGPAVFPLQGDFKMDAFPAPPHWHIEGRSVASGAAAWNGWHAHFGHLGLVLLAQDVGQHLKISGRLDGSKVEIRWNDLTLQADRIRAWGDMTGFPPDLIDGQAVLHLQNGHVSGKDKIPLQATGVELDIPWHVKPRDAAPGGAFSLKELQLGGVTFHGIGGRLNQTKEGYVLVGSARLPLNPLTCTFKGTLTPARGELFVSLAVEEAEVPPGTKLGVLHPLLAGMTGGGRIRAAVSVFRKRGTLSASGEIGIHAAALNIPDMSVSLSDLSGAVSFSDLANLVSEPKQRIQFGRVQLGNLSFTQGSLFLTIEPQKTVFIESGEAVWCGGRISVSLLRYAGAGKPLRFTLKCERVRFADLLNTLTGKAMASGEAQINGTIPVSLSDGGIVIENGYLYTTPGMRGNLKFSQSGMLSGGVPLVEEAIKDFNYEWLRISLNSLGGLLQMNVELNGAPAQKLPLTYDSKTRAFIPAPAGGRNVELQGLHLELKFKDIDLAYLLKHGTQLHLFDQQK